MATAAPTAVSIRPVPLLTFYAVSSPAKLGSHAGDAGTSQRRARPDVRVSASGRVTEVAGVGRSLESDSFLSVPLKKTRLLEFPPLRRCQFSLQRTNVEVAEEVY